jgi:hypothetical protein
MSRKFKCKKKTCTNLTRWAGGYCRSCSQTKPNSSRTLSSIDTEVARPPCRDLPAPNESVLINTNSPGPEGIL